MNGLSSHNLAGYLRHLNTSHEMSLLSFVSPTRCPIRDANDMALLCLATVQKSATLRNSFLAAGGCNARKYRTVIMDYVLE